MGSFLLWTWAIGGAVYFTAALARNWDSRWELLADWSTWLKVVAWPLPVGWALFQWVMDRLEREDGC